jgi:hypothetical protein
MDVLLKSLEEYYNDGKNGDNLLTVLDSSQKISLRIIDWFVTNYSKKNNIYYTIFKDGDNKNTFESCDNIYKQFNTYQSYKAQLKSFSKKRFDPFCRRERIKFKVNDKEIETTIGQLNFFKWAIENLIIDYINQNYKDIENDMNSSYSITKKQKKSVERKKRQELSKSAMRGLNCNKMKVIINFS